MDVRDAKSGEVKDDCGSLDVVPFTDLDDTGRKAGLEEIDGFSF